jgi:transcriptional regulator with XRE-family HTH domain
MKNDKKLAAKQAIAKNLSHAMKARNISQSELARRADVTQTLIFRLLNGTSCVNAIDFARISAAIGTTTESLMRDEFAKKTKKTKKWR